MAGIAGGASGDRPSRLPPLPVGVFVGGGMRPSSVFAGRRETQGLLLCFSSLVLKI